MGVDEIHGRATTTIAAIAAPPNNTRPAIGIRRRTTAGATDGVASGASKDGVEAGVGTAGVAGRGVTGRGVNAGVTAGGASGTGIRGESGAVG